MIKNNFLNNILLAFVWVALTGTFTFTNFIFGFVLCFAIMWLISTDPNKGQYFKRAPKVISFIFYFLYELAKANVQVATDVINRKNIKPGIVRVPMDAQTDLEITLLSNFINLTPGTVIIDISDDRKVVYIHSMIVRDRESFIHSIKNGYEKRLLEILR